MIFPYLCNIHLIYINKVYVAHEQGYVTRDLIVTKFKYTIFSNNQSSQVAQGSKGFAPSNSPPSTSPGGTTSGFGVTTGEPANN